MIIAILLATLGAEHDTWDAYVKDAVFTCPGPLDTLKTPRDLTLGGKTYKHSGYRMEVTTPDGDHKVVIGLISAIKDVSAGTKHNLAEALAWFKKEQVEWVVANGDLALEEFDLEEVIELLGQTGLPTLLTLGNSESMGSFGRTIRERSGKYPNIINGVLVRQIVADDVEFWTVPGYYDRRYVRQNAGCVYKQEDIDAMATLKPSSEPLVLVSHGPPKGKTSLDWIMDKMNVGDPMLTDLIKKKKIPFGLFGHILEAGGAAVGADLATRVPPGKPVSTLYVNAGSLSGDPWGMLDGSTSTGMAILFVIDGGKATYQVKHLSPPAEAAEE